MKKLWIRVIAFSLTLCMMLPMMQSVVFAVGSQIDLQTTDQPVVYDFTGVTDINATSLPSGESPVTKELYDNDLLNWTYIGRDSNQSNTMVGGTSADGQTVRNWDGLRLNSKKASGWIAIKIQSPGTGIYDIDVDYQTYKNYASVDIYVLPGDADIAVSLASAEAVGSINSYSSTSSYVDASAKLANSAVFTAGEEYTVVFHFPNPEEENLYACITSLMMTLAQDQDVALPQNYDFTGVADINATSLPNGVSPVTQALYDAGDLNWTYIGKDSTQSNTMVGGTSADGQTVRAWQGLRVNAKKANGWNAIKIQSPGTGEYTIKFGYQTYNNYASVDVYILPGSTTEIAAAVAATQSIGSINSYSNVSRYENAAITFDGSYEFSAGEEYIVVFHYPNPDEGNLYSCITGLTLEPVSDEPEETTSPEESTDPEETTAPGDTSVPEEVDPPAAPGHRDEVVYDFDLGSTELIAGGDSFATKALGTPEITAIAGYYGSYALDWKYLGLSADHKPFGNFGGQSGDRNYLWNGLRLYAKDAENAAAVNYYAAFTIRSPGNGKYYLTFDYQTHRYGAGKGNVYVLPGDTTDIAAAIAAGKALGTVCYDNFSASSGAAAVPESKSMSVGVDCILDEEYILVFTSEEPGAAGMAYLYIDKVTLTHESIMPQPEPEPQAPGHRDEVIYDFDLGSTDLTVSDESFATKALGKVESSTITGYYNTYRLDWKYLGVTDGYKASGNFGGTAGDRNYLWNGLRLYTKDAAGETAKNYYAAFTIRSPGTGKYYLTFDYQTHRYGASKGSIYILPADTTDIAATIAAGMAVGTVSYDNRSASGSLAAVSASKVMQTPIEMKQDQEYFLVFTADEKGKAGYSYLYLNQVKLTHESIMPKPEPEPEAPQLDRAEYDFALENTNLKAEGNSFATQNLGGGKIQAAVDGCYLSGKLNWTYLDRTKDSALQAVFGGKSGDKNYLWNGLRIYAKDKQGEMLRDYYVAFMIQSPGTGNYKMTVDYMVARYGAKKGSIYVLPGDTKDIAAAIASGKAIGSLNFDNGVTSGSVPAEPGRTTFSGNIAFEAGKEYIVVFRSHTVGRVDSYMYLTKLTLTKSGLKTPSDIIPERVPEPEPIPEGSTVYDLDIADGVTGIMKGKGNLPFLDTIDDVDKLYQNGTLNWTYASHYCLSDSSAAFKNGGMVFYSYEMEWVAIKIKSPGKGLHTISLNHAVSGNGAIGAVYILPADTQDVEKAMDPSNRVGKLSYANEDGTPAMVDGKRSVVGTWEFGDADEYIVVFEAYQHSPFVTQRGYMYVSQMIVTPGDHTKDDTASRKIKSIVIEAGPVKICEATLYGTTATIDGSAYLFVPIEGKKLLAYNLSDGVMEKEIKIPFGITRGMLTDKDGSIWMVGDKPYIYRYDPITGVGEQFASYKNNDLAPGATSGFDLVEDEEGCLYFGTYNTGAILKFDPSTEEYTRLCIPNQDAVYPVGMAVRDGYLYCGVYGDKNADGNRVAEAVKVDTKTGQIVARVDLEDMTAETATMYRGAGFAGNLFLLGTDGGQKPAIAIDINTMELVDINVHSSIHYGVTEELGGKVYFIVTGKGLHEMDVNTHEVKQVPGLESVTYFVRCGKDNFVDIGDPVYPGMSIATYSSGDAMPRIYNIESGNVRVWSDLLPDNYGNPTTIRPIISCPKGSNELVIGAYNSNVCSVFNTAEGKITHTFEATAAQTDAFVWYEGVLYTGNYNSANLTRINFDDPDRNVILMSLKSEYKQARIHTMTAGGGKVFIGSTPDRYEYGGCLAWVDINTLERHIERNVVKDQTINCIVYHDGYIYGTTSTAGGSGTAERPDLSAKLFVYDVENKKKVAEADLADYIPGLKTPIDWIYGIAADPKVDENGRFWGLVSETLFSFTFNKDTGKFSIKEEVSYDKQTYDTASGKNWFPRPFVFDEEDYLYLAFESNGGMRKINTNNVKDNTRVMDITPMYYALGSDGNIYYVQDQSLMMYPLNVTEEDWKIAEEMDTILKKLDPNVTLESEAAIAQARATYDALSWKHKALVQNVEILEFAEIDLLECKIDAIGEVTIDSKDLIYGLMEQYESLSERYQRYVKNADQLKESYLVMNAILDKIEADRVQKMIDAIKDMGEITLEHEQAIRTIRAAYEELTTMQKSYVDITLLLKAETKIKALRQVRIDRLIQLITQIGDPVTLVDEPVITEAMEIYNWMYMDEREQVDYEQLIAANNALTKLQKAAAAEVDALIENGEYRAARKAYDALTEGSKQYVQYYDYLLEMEAQTRLITIIAIVAGVIVVAGGVTAFLLIRKRKKAKAQ